MSKHNQNICDSKFFEALYNTYAKEIRRFLFYKTQDIDKSEDILQDVFIKLWENCNKVDPNKVKSYIYSIANNMFLNDIKHQKVVQNYRKHNGNDSTNESPEFILRKKEFLKRFEHVLSQLKDMNIDIYSFKQGIDTSTTMGSSFFHMVGIFAELENNLRSERQIVGIKRALKEGVKFGRKDVVDEETEYQIYQLRQQGKSYRKIADKVGISHTRVAKQCKSMSM